MKIGLFTFFQINYGAVLQAFALQHYLEQQFDTNVEVVDFTTPHHLLSHNVFQKPATRNPFYLIQYYFFTFIHYRQLKRRIRRTREFKEKYFHFTRRYSTIDDLLTNHPDEDLYLTGSDQVFNPNARYVPVYYLAFNKGQGKKAAYAPSFGISLFNDEITSRVAGYLKDFDYLSCREPAGADYMTEITGKKVPIVVDPVLLHDSAEWDKVAIDPSYNKDYIFIYDLNGAESLIFIAKNIQRHTGLPIVCLTNKRTKVYPVQKQLLDAGPAEFLGWIKNASYIVTDSFHGTAFSLVFAKQFFTYIALESTSSRITSLLKEVDLLNRVIVQKDLSGFDLDSYQSIGVVKMNQIINLSKDYIREILS